MFYETPKYIKDNARESYALHTVYCSCHISYNAYIYGFLQHILELASQHTCKKNYEKHRLVSGYSVDYIIKTGY